MYEDRAARDFGVERWAGYGVPAICDHPDCDVAIDRGVGYRCETIVSYPGDEDDDYEGPEAIEEEGCGMHFCSMHEDHSNHKTATPKPDTPEWMQHMLTDESWERWRVENPSRVAEMRAELVEAACEVMHDAYERAAVGAGWDTNPASRKPWAGVPEANKVTMRAAVAALLEWMPRPEANS